MEILRLAAQGLSNSAIAEIRDTGEKTVEKHLQAVYEALEIKQSPNSNRRVEAVRRFLRAAGSIPVDSH
jgi:DNA-binding NarL/FixJ family response regulator